MKYTKQEAKIVATEFITEVNKLEKKYNLTFNSDTGDVYLSFKTKDPNNVWDSIDLGWDGDGSGIKVKESTEETAKQKALNKLTDEDRLALGIDK